MIDIKMDKLAKSLAGHDKDCVYAVVKEEDSCVYLADGNGKTLGRPKKKNKKHVQMIVHLPEEISQILSTAVCDSDLVHVLRLYHSAVRKTEQ